MDIPPKSEASEAMASSVDDVMSMDIVGVDKAGALNCVDGVG